FRDYPSLIEKKKLYYWRIFIPLSIIFSKKIGTVSRFSLNRIMHYYPKSSDKLFVTVEGIRKALINLDNNSYFKKNYLLSVMSFAPHKSIETLLNALVI